MNGFIFYRSLYDSLKDLDKDLRDEIIMAICEYYFDNKEKVLSPIAQSIFTLIKPNVDYANKRYIASVENGKKGGAPIGNKNAQKTTQKQPRNNLETTQNNLKKEKEKEIEKEKEYETECVYNAPTLEEIQSYCLENGFDHFDCENFFDYYESIGWDGVKNWKAKLRYWVKNDKKKSEQKYVSPNQGLYDMLDEWASKEDEEQ